MRTRRLITTFAFGGPLMLGAAACAGDDTSSTSTPGASTGAGQAGSSMAPPETGGSMAPGATITDIVADDEQFSTLLAAVQAAGLGETLASDGPFTVFAPTDEAFAALPAGTLDTLLKARNAEDLSAILAYHVVSGDVTSADVEPGSVETVNGAPFEVGVDGQEITITDGAGNKAEVTTADIPASNGVIHVIDSVLLPPSA